MERHRALRLASAAVRAADLWLMRRWVRRRSRGLDRPFVAVSRTADRSLLWLIGGGVPTPRGGRGRSAAGRGILAIGIASATVNGPLKLSVGRACRARALRVQSLHVHTERPLEVALDGEVLASLPRNFEVVGEALRVMTPLDFEDVDD